MHNVEMEKKERERVREYFVQKPETTNFISFHFGRYIYHFFQSVCEEIGEDGEEEGGGVRGEQLNKVLQYRYNYHDSL